MKEANHLDSAYNGLHIISGVGAGGVADPLVKLNTNHI